MTGITHTYLFGRLSLLGRDGDKKSLIYNSMSSGVIQEDSRFKFGFFDPKDIEYNNDVFVYGKLVKYKPLLEGKIVLENTHQVVEGGLPDGVVAEAPFFFHYRSMVVAYRPIVNKLSQKQFRMMFGRLIEAANHDFFIQATLSSVNEEFELQESLRRFTIISKISFDVFPTNPSNRDVYKNIDERLKKLGAGRLQEKIEGKNEQGLNIDVVLNDDAYRGLSMASDGYGKAKVTGVLDGRKVTLATDDSPFKKDVVASETEVEILQQLYMSFSQIWGRMKR